MPACEQCGFEFPSLEVECLGMILRKRFCDPCVSARDTAPAKAEAPERTDAWNSLCGLPYRLTSEGGSTDLRRLQNACPELDRIAAWQFGPKGLLLRGETGKGKTRAAWRLMRRLFDEERTVHAITGGDFARQYADACGNFTRSQWFESLSSVEVLFVDDLGKSEWSSGTWGEFFELVEARAKRELPILLTTNESGRTLESKGKDPVTMAPLLRRLRENCETIVL